ncbi:LEAF RUST 10 DISEASE-RESISTANCE LOCUS RECEPTOR-LIKE PROTEIN KINASE-like 1.2 [Silene latifolia]|uniref:LEAF RUST 10 DISEASE-RESISTANCE LOCUS RECEPTOR-LIKE PROTEIN KINASE-like 1.2 n=1 Tax=Silene latifolia TaxID=37657 RepID=UPI003D78A6DA
MYQHNQILFSCIISIILLVFNNLIHPSSSAVVDEKYASCAPLSSTCGPSLNITYPFYDAARSNYCGYPGFAVECQGNSLTIEIEKQRYNVLDINYNSQIFIVSKLEFSQGPCPTNKSELTNSNLDLTLFNFTSSSENATLFYKCQRKQGEIAPFSFQCPLDGYLEITSTVFTSDLNFLVIDETWKAKVSKLCDIAVDIPVFKTAAADLENGKATVVGVVTKGFELKWTIDESQCKICTDTKGRCGFNHTSGQPLCLCQGGSLSKTCSASNTPNNALQGAPPPISPDQITPTKKTTSTGIAGITAAASGLFLLSMLGVGLYLYKKHRKKRSSLGGFGSDKILPRTLDANVSTYFGVQLLSYAALEEATEYFNPAKELGAGGYGTVYHGFLDDGREVAVKRLFENNSKRAEQFLNEVEILANLQHKNLVNLYGCTSRHSRELLLVYEYVQNGTVADHLHGKNANLNLLPWPTRLSIATETACALVYLHASDIIHRDVKTQNILLDKNFAVKVADFGLSRLFPLDVTHVSTAPQGTPGYLDPEYHQCYQLTEKSDVYSFGVLLAELMSSKPAVDVTRRRADINLCNMLISKIQSNTLDEFVDPSLGFQSDFKVKTEITALADLAFQCLQSTREMRPTMEEVLQRLYNIKDHKDKIVDRPEEVDISSDDAFILKGEYSPASSSLDDSMVMSLNTSYSSV